MSHKPTSPGGVCAVCGREGSKHELAIHYNTLSCIACKSFFYRCGKQLMKNGVRQEELAKRSVYSKHLRDQNRYATCLKAGMMPSLVLDRLKRKKPGTKRGGSAAASPAGPKRGPTKAVTQGARRHKNGERGRRPRKRARAAHASPATTAASSSSSSSSSSASSTAAAAAAPSATEAAPPRAADHSKTRPGPGTGAHGVQPYTNGRLHQGHNGYSHAATGGAAGAGVGARLPQRAVADTDSGAKRRRGGGQEEPRGWPQGDSDGSDFSDAGSSIGGSDLDNYFGTGGDEGEEGGGGGGGSGGATKSAGAGSSSVFTNGRRHTSNGGGGGGGPRQPKALIGLHQLPMDAVRVAHGSDSLGSPASFASDAAAHVDRIDHAPQLILGRAYTASGVSGTGGGGSGDVLLAGISARDPTRRPTGRPLGIPTFAKSSSSGNLFYAVSGSPHASTFLEVNPSEAQGNASVVNTLALRISQPPTRTPALLPREDPTSP